MLVRELVELLQQFDQDAEVVMSQAGGEYFSDLEFLEAEVREDGSVLLVD